MSKHKKIEREDLSEAKPIRDARREAMKVAARLASGTMVIGDGREFAEIDASEYVGSLFEAMFEHGDFPQESTDIECERLLQLACEEAVCEMADVFRDTILAILSRVGTVPNRTTP